MWRLEGAGAHDEQCPHLLSQSMRVPAVARRYYLNSRGDRRRLASSRQQQVMADAKAAITTTCTPSPPSIVLQGAWAEQRRCMGADAPSVRGHILAQSMAVDPCNPSAVVNVAMLLGLARQHLTSGPAYPPDALRQT